MSPEDMKRLLDKVKSYDDGGVHIPDISQDALKQNQLDADFLATQKEQEALRNAPAVPKSGYEMLSDQMDKVRADSKVEAQAADDADRKRMMIESAFKVLGTAGQADIQRRVGQDVGIDKFVAPKSANSGSKVLKERDSMLQDLRDKYKMLQEDTRYNASLGEKESARAEKLSEAQKERDLKRELAGELARTKASSKVAPKSKLQETREAIIAKRYGTLEENIPSMKAGIIKAKYLANALEKGEFGTGPLSETAGKVGSIVSLKSSSLKEELDSLAESAARAQLKASGEIRPTDDDVEGMKRAMFNLGNTEETNIKKLNEFIKQQEAGLDEYGQMKKVLNSGKGLEDFLLKDTYKNEPVTALEKQRSDAEKWALENPEDPRAVEILKRLGR